MPAHILVTGAQGYIGQQFCQRYGQQAEITPASLRQTPIDQINFQTVDCVLHLSARVHSTTADDAEHHRINCEQSLALARAAKDAGVKQFVFFSTMAVYGSHGSLADSGPLTEFSECQPSTAYGRSKYEAEQGLKKLSDADFNIAIIRPPMVYGAGCPGNMARLQKLVTQLPLLPFRYSSNRRSIVSIENLLTITWEVIQQQASGIFLPQDPAPISIQSLVEQLMQAQHVKPPLLPVPQWLLKALFKLSPRQICSLYGSLYYDSRHTEQQLQLPPLQTTAQGIHGMCTPGKHETRT